jgi:hypothetical protein
MKKFKTLIFATLFLSSQVFAQAPIFTSLSNTGNNVLAGVKLEKKDHEPETYILNISADSMQSKKINLPDELIHREIIGIFPAEKSMLLVISQRTVEQGDRPQFHSYDVSTQKWKKLAETDCKSLSKVKIEKASLVVSCSETNSKGNDVESLKRIELAGMAMSSPKEVTLPVVKDDSASLKAELVGDVFEWKELKVSLNNKQKVFKP